MTIIPETVEPVNLIKFPSINYPSSRRRSYNSQKKDNDNNDDSDDMLFDHKVFFERNKNYIDNEAQKLKNDYITELSNPDADPEKAFSDYFNQYSKLSQKKTELNIQELEAQRFYKDDVTDWKSDVQDKDIGGNVIVKRDKGGEFVPVMNEKGEMLTYDDYYRDISSRFGSKDFVKPELYSTLDKGSFEESIEDNVGDIKTRKYFEEIGDLVYKKETNKDKIEAIKNSFYGNLSSDQRKALTSDYYTQDAGNNNFVKVDKEEAEKDGGLKKGYIKNNGKYYRGITKKEYALNKLSQHLLEKEVVSTLGFEDLSKGKDGSDGLDIDNMTLWDMIEMGKGGNWKDAEIMALPESSKEDLKSRVFMMEQSGMDEKAINNMIDSYYEENYPEIRKNNIESDSIEGFKWNGGEYINEETGETLSVKEFEVIKDKERALDIINMPISKTEKRRIQYMPIPASLQEKASNTSLVNKDLTKGPNPKMYLNNYPVSLSNLKHVFFDNPEYAYHGFKSSSIGEDGVVKGDNEVRASGNTYIPLDEAKKEDLQYGSKNVYMGGEFTVGKNLLDGNRLSDEAERVLKANIIKVKDLPERFQNIYKGNGYSDNDKIISIGNSMVPWQAPRMGSFSQNVSKKEFLLRELQEEGKLEEKAQKFLIEE